VTERAIAAGYGLCYHPDDNHIITNKGPLMTTVKRQFITDAAGQPIAIILPLEEFNLVADTLEQRLAAQHLDDKLRHMEVAAHDPLFLADLAETMADFEHADADWWEQQP
jgi:hypothetical protein